MKKEVINKFLLLCLVASLMVMLAACKGSTTSAEKGTTEVAAPSSVAEGTSGDSAQTTVQTTVQTAEQTTEQTAVQTTEQTTVPTELFGTITETSYLNDYFGFRYDAPETWYLLSREDIAVLSGITKEFIDNEDLAEMFENGGYVTDLYAMDTVPAIKDFNGYNNVNLVIQDIGKLYGMLLDEKTIAEASVDTLKKTLESLGLTVINVEVTETEFIGKTCVSTIASSKSGDNYMYQKVIYIKKDSALALITATTIGEDKTDEIFAAFSTHN